MRIITMLFLLIIFLMSPETWAQELPAVAGSDTQSVPVAERSTEEKAVLALSEKYEAQWRARADQLETERKALDTLIFAAKLVGFVVVSIALGLTFFVGKSLSDLHSEARETALSAFDSALREKSKVSESLEKTAQNLQSSNRSLKEIEEELKGYASLRDVAEIAQGFDPLANYYNIRQEIQERVLKTKKMLQGDDSINQENTTYSLEFRQRAAVVFEGLLSAVRDDTASEKNRLSGNDLFNAAANAAEADLDFVALELMEIAAKIDNGIRPEIEARLIRQRLAGGRINPAEAREAIGTVLEKVTGFDLHLVVSEAFNIGLHTADPAGIAYLIDSRLRPELKAASYPKLNGARLLFMSIDKEDQKNGKEWYCDGLEALLREVPTLRWYSDSMDELAWIFETRPDLFDSCNHISLDDVFGKSHSIQSFAKKFGARLTSVLIEEDQLDRFLASGAMASQAEALLEAIRQANEAENDPSENEEK